MYSIVYIVFIYVESLQRWQNKQKFMEQVYIYFHCIIRSWRSEVFDVSEFLSVTALNKAYSSKPNKNIFWKSRENVEQKHFVTNKNNNA